MNFVIVRCSVSVDGAEQHQPKGQKLFNGCANLNVNYWGRKFFLLSYLHIRVKSVLSSSSLSIPVSYFHFALTIFMDAIAIHSY